MEIIQIVTFADVRRAKPETIWYAARTCWWTHDPAHLSTLPPTWTELAEFAKNLSEKRRAAGEPVGDLFTDARNMYRGLPCDPRGSVLMMTRKGDGEGFLKAAERSSAHYGKHGLRAFMAAHHRNCIESSTSPRPWSATDYDEYNDAIDRFDERLKLITTAAMAKLDELTEEN